MIDDKFKFYHPMIKEFGAKHSIDPILISAIIYQESSFNTDAVRFEPKLKMASYPYSYAGKLQITMETELNFQHCSWGLMQVLGVKARELGFDAPLHLLCNPYNGIEFGCRVLDKLFKRYDKIDMIIAAYNAGSALPSGNPNQSFVNQEYVDSVKAKILELSRLEKKLGLA